VVSEPDALRVLGADIASCSTCFPAGGNTPVVAIRPNARVLVIGQAPSLTDSRTGQTFSGPGGKRLRAWLEEAGVPLKDVSFSALTKCYPGRSAGGKGDRTPTRVEVQACRGFLEREVAVLQPRIVLLVGGMAIKELLSKQTLDQVVGRVYAGADCPLINDAAADAERVSVVPLPHCSGASLWLNRPEHRALLATALNHVRRLYATLS
jgi:uracil-DNA glycosylase